MTRYHGLGGSNVFVLGEDGHRRGLQKRPGLLDRPPVPFAWGDTDRRGRTLLAISLLADAVDDDTAQDLYQTFEQDVLAHLPASWTLTRNEILHWIDRHQGDLEADDERGVVA